MKSCQAPTRRLTVFDSITKALAYLRENITRFFGMKSTLQSRLTEIERLTNEAKQSNDQASMGRLIVAKSQTYALLREYEAMTNKLNPFRTFFSSDSSPTLGILPVWIATGAATLAASLYLFFQKVQNDGKALDLIKAGILKPSEAQAILSGGGIGGALGSASSVVMWGVLAYALFLFGPQLSKRI